MSDRLLRCAGELRVDNKIVSWEELLSSNTLLNEVRHALKRHGWPSSPEEIRQELLKLHGRWKRQSFKSEASRRVATNNPYLWVDNSEDDDDNFMPSGAASSKGKSAPSSKGKSAPSSKGKSAAS